MDNKNTAIIPTSKLEDDFYDWFARHEEKKAFVASQKFDIIFIGDSITHLFEGDTNVPNRGEKVWEREFAEKKVLNLGFGWDRTQNVLWRLQNDEFLNQKPSVVVLNIGTNNLSTTQNARSNTAQEIAKAIELICNFVHENSAKTQIILMGIFPRGLPTDPIRKEIQDINSIIAQLANKPLIQFLNIENSFLEKDQSISIEIMSDLVHPTEKGYEIWLNHLLPLLI